MWFGKSKIDDPYLNHMGVVSNRPRTQSESGGMSCTKVYQFGRNVIPSGCVFLTSALSYAFTNRKPVVTGHILVSSLRPVERFADLTVEEVSDLFRCVHRIAPVLQRVHSAPSLTIAVQDGAHAGQTVPHVHVHMLPRKPGDFPHNDDIYNQLERHDSTLEGGGEERREEGREEWREEKEMEAEATQLKAFFTQK